MIKKPIYYFMFVLLLNCNVPSSEQNKEKAAIAPSTISQDSITTLSTEYGAWKHPLYSQEWQEELDKGLAMDSTIAFLWQQKSMPLYKQGKYELGKPFIDKAVKYDPNRWQDYRAFMTCIFSKRYAAALEDFKAVKARMGYSYVMDHSYDFYMALCHLQLNNFKEAAEILKYDLDNIRETKGEDWVHYLDLFYYGVSLYELKKYDEALVAFDQALEKYPEFSDVLYYKGIVTGRLGDREKGQKLIDLALEYGKKGYSITEDNVIYERYPYQVRWQNR